MVLSNYISPDNRIDRVGQLILEALLDVDDRNDYRRYEKAPMHI